MKFKNHFSEKDIGNESIEWKSNPAIESQIMSIIMGVILLPVAGIGLLVLASVYTKVNFTTYAITNKALYKKKGMLSDKTKRVPLSKIQNTEYSRLWVEKKFGFGTVQVSSAGSSGKEITFDSVPNPKEVQDLINEMSERNKSKDKEHSSNQDLKYEIIKTRENLEYIVNHLENKK